MPKPPPPVILIVDDQASTRTILREALVGERGATVIEATDGEMALRQVEKHRPDVILCDIQMKPVDGLTFLATIRGHKDVKISLIPVIIMTGVATREVVAAAHQSGATSILAKPISLGMLKVRLDAALRA